MFGGFKYGPKIGGLQVRPKMLGEVRNTLDPNGRSVSTLLLGDTTPNPFIANDLLVEIMLR